MWINVYKRYNSVHTDKTAPKTHSDLAVPCLPKHICIKYWDDMKCSQKTRIMANCHKQEPSDSGGARWPVVKILFAICIRRLGLYFVSKIDSENRATSGDFRPFKFTFKTVVWDDGEYWEKSDLSWISNLLRMPVKLDPPQDAPCNPDHWVKLTQHSVRVVTLFCGILFGPHFRFWNKFDIMSRRCHSIWQPNESFPVDLVSEKF